jgi:hypothetical protein
MLKLKIIEWIDKTFGKLRHKDRFDMNSKVSEVEEKGAVLLIEEIGFVFQRMNIEASKKEVEKWKRELEEIIGNGELRGFQVGVEDLYGIASPEDIQKGGVQEGSIVGGKAMMMNVMIYKQTFLANSILFPGKLNSNRRH